MQFIWAYKDETYYIQKLKEIQKECWKDYLNKYETILQIDNYLAKRRFNKERYLFITELQNQIQLFKQLLLDRRDDNLQVIGDDILKQISTYNTCINKKVIVVYK